MKILGLEFSSEERSAAVGEAISSDVRIVATRTEQGPRGCTGMTLIDQVLRTAELAPEQIDALAIGLGPGSYAGIRSAIAIAQGWQLARSVRLIGISSADVIAQEAQERGIHGAITILIDAQRSEFYQARYLISTAGIEGGALSIVTAEQVDHSGTVIAAATLFPSAAALIRAAASRADSVPGEKLEPIYLRETSFVKAPPPRFA